MTEWFADWFGDAYLELYPHRDVEDARRILALISATVQLPGARVLDLACGQGRHAVQIHELGANVTGVDLSAVLLKKARYGTPPIRDLVRADMRTLPFRPEAFDVIVNLFTSFGYFQNDDEHRQVVKCASALLVDGGWFVMDFLNADQVRAGLVASEKMKVNGRVVDIQRRLIDDGAYVQKDMRMLDDGVEHVERVRLFSAQELTDMMHAAGLTVVERFGDYSGGPLVLDSPRAILFARKS